MLVSPVEVPPGNAVRDGDFGGSDQRHEAEAWVILERIFRIYVRAQSLRSFRSGY